MPQLSAVVFMLILGLCPPAHAVQARTIRVGAFPVPPILSQDSPGEFSGIYAELIEQIAARENWTVQWVPGTWAEGLARVRAGEIDLMPVVIPTPQRAVDLDFCLENVLMIWGQVYVANGSPLQSILDLEGQRVAVMKDDLNGENFVARTLEFGMTCVIVEVESHDEVFEQIAEDKVVAGVAPNLFGYESARRHGVVAAPILFDPSQTTFATAAGHNTDLLATIDRYLRVWKKDPQSVYAQALRHLSSSPNDSAGKLPRWLLSLGAGILVIALLLLLWNRVLNARVKARTRELVASQAKIRIIFDQTYQFLGLLDTRGHLLEVNRTAADFLHAEPEDFIGLPFWDCPWWNHDPVVQEEVKQGIRTALSGTVHFGETRHIDPEGKPHTLQYTIKPTLDATGQVESLIAEGLDITDKHELEDELRQSQRMESIGTLAGGIAHDFNNILTAIIGFNEMAMDDAEGQPGIESSLREVALASARARDLVQQILTFGRRQESEKSTVCLSLILREAIKLLRSTLPSTIHIEMDIRSEECILANPTQLHQIVMNLGTNAFHAMEEKGGQLDISLREIEFNEREPVIGSRMPAGRYLQLEISDTGPGMDEHVLEKIFEPYFTTKEPGKGTGLGLAVVHGIVQSSAGYLRVQSEPGAGSTFQIYFPALSEEAGTTRRPDLLAGSLRGTERILFIDDERSLTQLVSRYLTTLGYRVTALSDSEQAWRQLEADPDRFDLVVTDQTMPGLTGTALVTKMRENGSRLPVILCTGNSMSAGRGLTPQLEIARVLQKPMMMKELATEIRNLLGEARPQFP